MNQLNFFDFNNTESHVEEPKPKKGRSFNLLPDKKQFGKIWKRYFKMHPMSLNKSMGIDFIFQF